MHATPQLPPPGWALYLGTAMLVWLRVGTLFVFAPVFSTPALPVRVKAAFAVAVTVLLLPVTAGLGGGDRPSPLSVTAVLGEILLGWLFGFTLSLLNEMLLFAGQIAGMQFSFSLVNLLDPNSRIETPLLGTVFTWLGVLVLIGSGLDRTLLHALLRSFVAIPPGGFHLSGSAARTAVALFQAVLVAGLQLVAPLLAATVVVEFSIALMGKLSPQLPVLALTVPAKNLAGTLALVGSLALWPAFLEGRFAWLLDRATALAMAAAGGR